MEKDLKEYIIKELKKATKLKEINLEIPPSSNFGDYAFPCYPLAKILKKNPNDIAVNLSKKIEKNDIIQKIETNGPYINFFVNKSAFSKAILTKIFKEKGEYGLSNIGKKEKVMVEYSSPNTNKPLHLGHLRNDSIGMAISNILSFTGHDVTKSILYSNRGIHICKSMLAYQHYGKNKKPTTTIKPDHFVGKFYILYEKKKTKKLEAELGEMLRKWEAGDKKTRALWKKMDAWAIKGFKETYQKFGSEFDVEFRESDFYNKAKPIIELGLKKNIFIKDEEENRIIANLEEHGLADKTILRGDQTSIYITNDLALTKHKFEKFKLDSSVWVVGSEQNLYFQQLFKILELLGFNWSKNCHHMSYGMVYLPEGKMKSREGIVVDADDIIKSIITLSKKEIKKRYKKISKKELEERAEKIGIGALKFFLLKTDTRKDIHFNPEESLSFEGETGPYVQYVYARISSLIKRSKLDVKDTINYMFFDEEAELALIKLLGKYPKVLENAATNYKPYLLARYLLELAQKFNEFYQYCPILKSEEHLMQARLLLAYCVKEIIGSGLKLLGIDVLEEM
ncbi:MAG: arginine--tRNA ligase [Candidatus Woesearchaeota archaeon]|jgi:arginyl-tRNA synthetase|nr:arginine--tRNA ligase [Candidatus Woesearchaeota archaeon]|tara:strand:- start:4329 stop:6029 length:1701 start_codon:yes stop_codon:yes gene_type:complete